MRAHLRFHGAAKEVTGSMHLIEVNGDVICLDCGLFQGRRAEANAKNRTLPCDPRSIAAVILTHAHIDHCGRLPLLVKSGFAGAIYATPATCDLAEVLLADSAHIQQEDAEYWNKKRVMKGDAPIEPLYNQIDVDDTVKLFRRRELRETFDLLPGIRARLHEAGHMLGSCGAKVDADLEPGKTRSIVYTGDLGRKGMEILRDPDPLPECDYLICESTYGGRQHSRPEQMREEFAEIVNETIARGGKLIIPSFAVGRTQVLVYEYHMCLYQGLIPKGIPLVVDSPLAVRATEVFRKHPEVFDEESSAFNHLTGDMLSCDDCEYTQDVEESKRLHDRKGPMIIISASGMCEVGRILHHLKNNIENPANTILIVGFQAENTLGRRLLEKAKQVKIFGETYQVKAKIKVLTGFSAHANSIELMAAVEPLAGRLRRVFLVHGEAGQSQTLAETMRKNGLADVVIPEPDQRFPID
ncbi:MAG: MBL fold metallo-hydrolase [Phycisphaerae bacterium]